MGQVAVLSAKEAQKQQVSSTTTTNDPWSRNDYHLFGLLRLRLADPKIQRSQRIYRVSLIYNTYFHLVKQALESLQLTGNLSRQAHTLLQSGFCHHIALHHFVLYNTAAQYTFLYNWRDYLSRDKEDIYLYETYDKPFWLRDNTPVYPEFLYNFLLHWHEDSEELQSSFKLQKQQQQREQQLGGTVTTLL